MKGKYTFAVLSVLAIGILGVGMVSAFGLGNGFFNSNLTEDERLQLQEERDSVRAAIENSDYEAWKSLMEAQIVRMQESLTEENFQQIVERHSSDFFEMKGQGKMLGHMKGRGMNSDMGSRGCVLAE